MNIAIKNSLNWLPGYLFNKVLNRRVETKHIFFSICDHFEPYNNGENGTTARKRIGAWVDNYPRLVEKIRDADGRCLRYSFFYPEEEYVEEDMNLLAQLCRDGFGEVEIHLHHDNDTPQNLRKTLLDYKYRLHEKHGLLSLDKETGDVTYGFIHGNWALCNSRRDGRWCGVNEELTILQETGCYADFTMPSAPSDTQTRKINSIYYAQNRAGEAKSHDTGIDAEVGKRGDGLLMVQGPLGLNWKDRKFGVIPRLENSGLYPRQAAFQERIECWINQGVHVKGAPDSIFIKLYNHGCSDLMIDSFLKREGLTKLLDSLALVCHRYGISLHFVTAREMVNIIKASENSYISYDKKNFDFRYISANPDESPQTQ